MGTYLLFLEELLPSVLQHMLVTHGVALEVAAFSCHHIATQGKEAVLKVVFPERDLKRKGHYSQQLQREGLTRQGPCCLGSQTQVHISATERHGFWPCEFLLQVCSLSICRAGTRTQMDTCMPRTKVP